VHILDTRERPQTQSRTAVVCKLDLCVTRDLAYHFLDLRFVKNGVTVPIFVYFFGYFSQVLYVTYVPY